MANEVRRITIEVDVPASTHHLTVLEALHRVLRANRIPAQAQVTHFEFTSNPLLFERPATSEGGTR